MGALLGSKKPDPVPVPKILEPKLPIVDSLPIKKPSEIKSELLASPSPDTDVVKEGVNKVMKKGRASTIITGSLGDTSKPTVFKPLLGGY